MPHKWSECPRNPNSSNFDARQVKFKGVPHPQPRVCKQQLVPINYIPVFPDTPAPSTNAATTIMAASTSIGVSDQGLTTVRMTLHDVQNCKALIDSGATHLQISEKLFRSMKGVTLHTDSDILPQFVSADGSKIHVLGYVEIRAAMYHNKGEMRYKAHDNVRFFVTRNLAWDAIIAPHLFYGFRQQINSYDPLVRVSNAPARRTYTLKPSADMQKSITASATLVSGIVIPAGRTRAVRIRVPVLKGTEGNTYLLLEASAQHNKTEISSPIHFLLSSFTSTTFAEQKEKLKLP